MNIIDTSRLHRILEEGFDFDILKYLDEGFLIYRNRIFIFSIYALLLFLFYIGLSILNFQVIFTLISLPLMANFIILADDETINTRNFKIGHLVSGFKYFSYLFQIQLFLAFILITIFFIQTYFLEVFLFYNNVYYYYAYLGASSLFYSVFMSTILWSPFFIIFGNYSAIDGVGLSWKVFKKNMLLQIIFTFLLVSFLAVGRIVSIFSYFLTVPIIVSLLYASFASIFGLINEEEEDDILKHLID